METINLTQPGKAHESRMTSLPCCFPLQRILLSTDMNEYFQCFVLSAERIHCKF